MKIKMSRNAIYEYEYDFNILPKPFGKYFYEYINEHYLTKKKVDGTLISEFESFKNYSAPFFFNLGIKSFAEINIAMVYEFQTYLNTTITSSSETLSKSMKRNIFGFFKTFMVWLSRKYPKESPNISYFKPNPYSKGVNGKLKTKYIEDDVLKQVKIALRNEQNPYLKAFLAVTLYMGLRLEDVLELTEDCLLEDTEEAGHYILHYYNRKSSKWIRKSISKNAISIVKALKLLIEETKSLRAESKDKRIFIRRNIKACHGPVGLVKRYGSTSINALIKKFIKTNNIVSTNGTPVILNSRTFRHTLLTNMDASGISLEVGQHIADHANPMTTQQYYIHSKDTTYNEQMKVLDDMMNQISIVESIKQIDDDVFQNNHMSLRLSDGYCIDTKMATQNDYICEHYQKRGNCYGCSKMVTSLEFLPNLEDEMLMLKKELEEKSQYGENVLRQIHFRIEMLAQIIKRLEDIT